MKSRKWAVGVAVLIGVAGGCKKEEGGSGTGAAARPGSAAAAATSAPVAAVPAVDVEAILRAGGKNWSAIAEGETGPGVPAAGSDYWIWPVEDVVYVPKRGANAVLAVKLNWRLRPGAKPADEQLYATVTAAGAGATLTLRDGAKGFDPRAEEGTVEVRFAPWQAGVSGDVTVVANRPGSAGAASNVLRLKVATPAADASGGKPGG